MKTSQRSSKTLYFRAKGLAVWSYPTTCYELQRAEMK